MCKLHIIQGLGFLNLKDTLIDLTILRTSKKLYEVMTFVI